MSGLRNGMALMGRLMRSVTFLFALLLLPGLASQAQEMADPDRIDIVTEDWRPYSYEEAGEVKGSATEIVLKTVQQAGLDYQIAVYPWARGYKKTLSHKNTLIYALADSPSRRRVFHFVGPVAPVDVYYFYRLADRDEIQASSLEDVKQYNVGTSTESAVEDYLRSAEFPHLQSVFAVSQLFKMMDHGRVDLFVSTEANIRAHEAAGRFPEGHYVPVYETMRAGTYMAFGPNVDAAILERMRAAYQTLLAEGQIPDFGAP